MYGSYPIGSRLGDKELEEIELEYIMNAGEINEEKRIMINKGFNLIEEISAEDLKLNPKNFN